MRGKLKALVVAAALAVTPLAVSTITAPAADAACNLHVVYKLYFWGGMVQTTTYYSVYRYFVDHNMGLTRILWVC